MVTEETQKGIDVVNALLRLKDTPVHEMAHQVVDKLGKFVQTNEVTDEFFGAIEITGTFKNGHLVNLQVATKRSYQIDR